MAAEVITKETRNKLLQTLAELGGEQFRAEDDIIHKGSQLVLPMGMSLDEAIQFLATKQREWEEEVNFVRKFKYRPLDGAVCTWRAIKRVFGSVGTRVQYGMFGEKVPPAMIDVPIAPGETESVPWGVFTIPGLRGATVTTGTDYDDELGPLFQVQVNAPRKYRPQVEGLFSVIQEELDERSIYRGRAFDGQSQPEFLDLSGVDPDKVVYSQETVDQLDANIWTVLRYREELKAKGISRKRSALLYGPYGTGKTLGGFLTAQVAVESGWTFLYARPGKDDVNQVLQTARLYQPACVFFEDLDTVADPDSTSADGATRLLDSFDGITAKGTELMVVLTTNHPDRIHKGMLRPGRLDACIEIGKLDVQGIERLTKVTLPDDALAGDVDWELVGTKMDGFLPAYAGEAATRAWRYALARTGKADGIVITTEDLVHAADGLRPQLEMMDGAKEHQRTDAVGVSIKHTVQDAIVHMSSSDMRDNWDSEVLAAVEERHGKVRQ